MNTPYTQLTRMVLLAGACVLAALSQGCTRYVEPKAFASPEEAVGAMTAAVRANDREQMRAIFGSDGDEILFSGDDVDDANRRARFLALYEQKHAIARETPEKATVVIGDNDWPFPVPVVQDQGKWYFDAAAGAEEILNRRIGSNELAAIQVCKAIGDAQQEYALRDPDGDGVREYARKFPSDPGKRDGLYWPAAEGEAPSPLGELAAYAASEGYTRKAEGPTPFHGYYYRILTAQGPSAPGGAVDYIVKGKMILGFAVVAYPASYDNSGIMTFIMGPDGVVYQQDLGEDTAKIAGEMKVFDPDTKWKKAE